jgi:hypothetical protein
MTSTVFKGVPIPKRAGGRTSEGLYGQLQALTVGEMLFIEGGSSRSTSATVARVAKTAGMKFTSRKCARIGKSAFELGKIVASGTERATEGLGVWRVQ